MELKEPPIEVLPTVEFEMSIEKITFRFKGDEEAARRVKSQINDFMKEIQNIQDKLLNIQSSSGSKAEQNVAASGGNTKTRRGNRPSGSGARAQILALRKEGFFATPRLIGDVSKRLSEKGHNFNSKELSGPLKALTQQSVLVRQGNSEDQFEYTEGPNVEPISS